MGRIKNVPKIKEITFENRVPTNEEKRKAINSLEEVLLNMFLYYYKTKKK